jgi:protein CMS1
LIEHCIKKIPQIVIITVQVKNSMAEKPSSSSRSQNVNKKRKRQAEHLSKDKSGPFPNRNVSHGPSKKRKHNKATKEALPMNKKSQERKGSIDESISKLDSRLLADYCLQKAKKHNKELTTVELNDLQVPGEKEQEAD